LPDTICQAAKRKFFDHVTSFLTTPQYFVMTFQPVVVYIAAVLLVRWLEFPLEEQTEALTRASMWLADRSLH
jgi:hypothetical protein